MHQGSSLIRLQSDLVDAKVEVSVSRAVAAVVEQIISLRQEMHQMYGALREEMHQMHGTLREEMHREIGSLRGEMHQEIGSLREEMHDMRHEFGTRLSAVETALNMRREKQQEIRQHFLDYTFKIGWLFAVGAFSTICTMLANHWHQF